MNAAERERLRALVNQARRAGIHAVCPRGIGNASGYRNGCRCRACTIAATAARNERRRIAREEAA